MNAHDAFFVMFAGYVLILATARAGYWWFGVAQVLREKYFADHAVALEGAIAWSACAVMALIAMLH